MVVVILCYLVSVCVVKKKKKKRCVRICKEMERDGEISNRDWNSENSLATRKSTASLQAGRLQEREHSATLPIL